MPNAIVGLLSRLLSYVKLLGNYNLQSLACLYAYIDGDDHPY